MVDDDSELISDANDAIAIVRTGRFGGDGDGDDSKQADTVDGDADADAGS